MGNPQARPREILETQLLESKMLTFGEVLINLLSILVGLLGALVSSKLTSRILHSTRSVDLYAVLGFIALAFAFLIRSVIFSLIAVLKLW